MLPIIQHYYKCNSVAEGYDACLYDLDGNNIKASDDWHIYGFEWDEDYLTFYIDNMPLYRSTNDEFTFENKLDRRDGIQYLVLNNAITDQLHEPGIGDGDPVDDERDFQIEYVKVWQKKGHLADAYFADKETGLKIESGNFLIACNYRMLTTHIPDATYTWTSSSGIFFSDDCASPLLTTNTHDIYFCATAPGDQWIKLTVTRPKVGLSTKERIEAKTFYFEVLNEIINDCDAPDCTVCEGEEAVFTISPISDDMTFQWKKGGAVITGATNSEYSTTSSGSYKCEVSLGCIYETNAVLLHVISDDDPPCQLRENESIVKNSVKLLVYPNPASDEVVIEFPGFSEADEVELELCDLLGKRLRHWKYSCSESCTYTISVAGIPSGLYCLKAQSNNWTLPSTLIVQ